MKKILKFFSFILAISVGSVITAIAGTYFYLAPNLPDAKTIVDIELQTPLKVYSYDGLLLGTFGGIRRAPIVVKDVPEQFINAFLAAEDAKFYSHIGLSPKGLSRAVWQKLSRSRIQTGGSTITMQVAKNYFLSPERTIKRKVSEIFIALQLEYHLSKDQILERYLNKIFLGKRAYGIAAASQVYYGKRTSELSLAQMAMIAGLPKAPSANNPLNNPKRALIRRNWILGRMKSLNYIDEPAYQLALKEPMSAKRHKVSKELYAPYVAEMARQKAIATLGPEAITKGYKIITTVHSKLQQTADTSLKQGLSFYDQRHGYRGPIYKIDTLKPNPIEDFFDSSRSRKIGKKLAAVVSEVEKKSVKAELRNQTIITIEWNNGLSSARPYINENKIGKSPQSANEFLDVGDVIRVEQHDDKSWHLTQVPRAESALVSLDPKDGAIVALVGGYDFQKSKFNRATQAERQVGSNIKPFIYAAALENGYTAASLINDAPFVQGSWRPKNSGHFRGPTRLREALYSSLNMVSIRLVKSLGIGKTRNYLSRLGFDRKFLPKDLTLALGSSTYTPLTVATAYSTLANGGFKVNPYLIAEIYDNNDKLIYKANPDIACDTCDQEQNLVEDHDKFVEAASLEELTNRSIDKELIHFAERVIPKDIVFIVDSILKDVITKGTARKAKRLGRKDIAGKTGTTNGPTDTWFSGYNAEVVTTVWVGFNNNSPLGKGEYGSKTALPIWMDFMREALKCKQETLAAIPESITHVLIDKKTGKRAVPGKENTRFEYIQSDLVSTLQPEEKIINEQKLVQELFN